MSTNNNLLNITKEAMQNLTDLPDLPDGPGPGPAVTGNDKDKLHEFATGIPDDVRKAIKIEKQFVSEKEAKEANDKNAIFLDDDTRPSNVGDLEKLTTELVGFITYINGEDMEKLAVSDYNAYIGHLEEKFDDFSLNYHSIFKMLTDKESINNREENIQKLISLIEVLMEVKQGKRSMDKEFENFRETKAQEYVYPKFGGKEQFEETMKKRAKRKQRRKHK